MSIASKILMCAALLGGAGVATATNIVQNPGFEQGVLGWEYKQFDFYSSPLWAHTGPGMVRLTYCWRAEHCLDNICGGAFVGQLLATTPGQAYDLSFCVRSFAGDSRISVFWDGVEMLKTPTPNGPMLQYSLSGLMASANATYLEVHAYNDTDKHLSFDDFSVAQVAAPPAVAAPPPTVFAISEPDMFGFLPAALGGMVFVQRRRW